MSAIATRGLFTNSATPVAWVLPRLRQVPLQHPQESSYSIPSCTTYWCLYNSTCTIDQTTRQEFGTDLQFTQKRLCCFARSLDSSSSSSSSSFSSSSSSIFSALTPRTTLPVRLSSRDSIHVLLLEVVRCYRLVVLLGSSSFLAKTAVYVCDTKPRTPSRNALKHTNGITQDLH